MYRTEDQTPEQLKEDLRLHLFQSFSPKKEKLR